MIHFGAVKRIQLGMNMINSEALKNGSSTSNIFEFLIQKARHLLYSNNELCQGIIRQIEGIAWIMYLGDNYAYSQRVREYG